MSFLRSLIITGLVVLAGLHFGSNYAVEQMMARWLGTEVHVGRIQWGFSKHCFKARQIRIANPAGYSKSPLAEISLIQGDYDISRLKQGIIKVTRLEIHTDKIRLERKLPAAANILEINPVLKSLGQPQKKAGKWGLPLVIEIEKVEIIPGRVFFDTKLGNDWVAESRPMEKPEQSAAALSTPDSTAIYVVLAALRAAGWEAFVPSREEAAAELRSQMNLFLADLRVKARELQAYLNHILDEQLKEPEKAPI